MTFGDQIAAKSTAVKPSEAPLAETLNSLKRFFGTAHPAAATKLINQIKLSNLGANQKGLLESALDFMEGIAPKDQIEGMLAAQMVATHNIAMDLLCKAMIPGVSPERSDVRIKLANKLLTTFAAQVETLNRHRGKGQQRIVVERVTVNEGGQAIVGNIAGGGGGQ